MKHEEIVTPTPRFVELFGPALVIEEDIFKHTALKPSHILVPASLNNGAREKWTLFGMPVMWTDEDVPVSLVYAPPTRKDD